MNPKLVAGTLVAGISLSAFVALPVHTEHKHRCTLEVLRKDKESQLEVLDTQKQLQLSDLNVSDAPSKLSEQTTKVPT